MKTMKLSPAQAEADGLLAEVGQAQAELLRAQESAAAAMANVHAVWNGILVALQARLQGLDAAIVKLAKQRRIEFFDGTDRLDLPHGALLHSWQEAVKKARGVLAQLKNQGLTEAIQVVETVKWEVLNGWPEEKLIQVGTERRKQEVFAYEVNPPAESPECSPST